MFSYLPWTTIPLIGRVGNNAARAASQATIVPDQGFLHSIAVEVCAVCRVDLAGDRSVVQDLAAFNNVKDFDVLDLNRPVDVVLPGIGPNDEISLAVASIVELVKGD